MMRMHEVSLPGIIGVKVCPLPVVFEEERRGLSRGGGTDVALTDREFGGSKLPEEFFKTTSDAINNYTQPSTPYESGQSSPTEEAQSWLSFSNNWTSETGGNTTERSSIYSNYFVDEEFERDASKTVRQLFEEIDSVLFEQSSSGPKHIVTECQEWVDRFPHLRILGEQMLQTQDMGYLQIPQETPRPATGSVLQDVTEQELSGTIDGGLTISGRQLHVQQPPVDAVKQHTGAVAHNQFSHLEEEIFESEGEVEEIIAVDHIGEDEGFYHPPRRRRPGFPPLTPSANARDSILNGGCEYILGEFWAWLRGLVEHYWSRVSDHLDDDEDVDELPELPISHFPDITNIIPPSRESTKISDKMGRFPIMPMVTHEESRGLPLCMQITSIPLYRRENSGLAGEMPVDQRPNSSFKMQRPSSMMQVHRNNSATIRKRVPTRLAPLDSRVRTPAAEEDRMHVGMVQGHRMQTASDRLSSPPLNNFIRAHHGPLPPIMTDAPDRLENLNTNSNNNLQSQKQNVQSSNATQGQKNTKKVSTHRASSAVHNEQNAKLKEREKAINQNNEPRPSTTHTFRSDTPGGAGPYFQGIHRRSSTPLGNYAKGIPAHVTHPFGSPGHREMLLGITGNSINHPANNENGPSSLEEEDTFDEPIIQSQSWGPTTSHRRGKQQTSFVR